MYGCGVGHKPSTFRLPVTYATNALRKATPAPVFELQQTKVTKHIMKLFKDGKVLGIIYA